MAVEPTPSPAVPAPPLHKSPLGGHWRPPLAAVVGAATGYGLGMVGLKPGAAALMGWDAAAVVFLLTTGFMLLTDDEHDLRRRACHEDEPPLVLSILVIAAMTFGFAAIVIAMREGSGGAAKGGGGGSPLLGVVAIATLVLSWLSLQALFTLHYAHRYFGDPDRDGQPTEGIKMTGDEPRTYRDFIYIAVCIGACFQVSDFGPTNTKFRNLITVHALISFAFNALVISLGVGIIGDLLKG